MSRHSFGEEGSPTASEPAGSPAADPNPAISSASTAARSTSSTPSADRGTKRPPSLGFERSPESAPLPAFYPAIPLLPSSADLAFISSLPAPCVRSYAERSESLPASEAHVDPVGHGPHAPAASNPRTPSPPSFPTVTHASPTSPPPTVSRLGPSTPPPVSNRAALSALSSTPPASPQLQSGPAAPAPVTANPPNAVEDEDFEAASTLVHCHRKLWTGQTAHGVRLQRGDTWALGPAWRRHVRVIEGVSTASPPSVEANAAAMEVEVGPGVPRPGTW